MSNIKSELTPRVSPGYNASQGEEWVGGDGGRGICGRERIGGGAVQDFIIVNLTDVTLRYGIQYIAKRS